MTKTAASTQRPTAARAPESERAFAYGGEPGFLIRSLHQAATRHFLDITEGEDITPVQFAALSATGSHPGLDQQAVAALIEVDRTTINQVSKRLEAKGWISRTAVGRQVCMHLTDAGEAKLASVMRKTALHADRLFDPLTAQQRQTFVQLLNLIVGSNEDPRKD